MRYFFIIGLPQHGKTTTSKILEKLLGVASGSTSDYVYQALALKRGVTVEALRRIPKESLRPELVVTGDAICAINPTGLVEGLIGQGVTVIDGVRRKAELAACAYKLKKDGHQVMVWWIENPRVPKIPDNTEVTQEDAQKVIQNDGTIAALETRLQAELLD